MTTPPTPTPPMPASTVTRTVSVKKTRPRWPWILGGLVLLAALGGGAYRIRQQQATQTTALPTSTATQVEQGTVRVSVSGPGTLTAPNSVTVSATQGGTVGTLPGVGDEVTKGQLITTLTNDTVLSNLQTARLNLQKAQAALDSARSANITSAANRQSAVTQAQATAEQAQQSEADAQRALNAQQQLWNIGATSRENLASAQSALNKAQVTLQSAQASLRSAQLQVQTGRQSDTQNVQSAQVAVDQAQVSLTTAQQAAAQLKVYAPLSGVVSAVNVTPGTNLNLNASGAALLTILDDRTLYLPAQIDETEISNVKVGQQASVTLDALDGQTFTGKVITVSPSGTQSSGIAVFTATVKLNNPDHVLKSGMTAEAEIIQNEQSGLLVPSKAIQSVRTRSYVQVVDKVDDSGAPVGTPQRVRVQVGATDGTNTVVTDGLHAGQYVVVAGSKAKASGTRSSAASPAGGFGGPPGGMP